MVRVADATVVYRWGVAILAAAVWVWCFADARLAQFGWQFRCIEIWALSASVVSAIFMLRLSMGWSRSRHEGFVRITAALNCLVVAIHLLPLVSDVPASDLGPSLTSSFKTAHLLAIGPLLQIADAVLILGVFRGPLRSLADAAAGVALVAATYVAWIELAVRPLNARADGRGGLPYGALDPLEPDARLAVYGVASLGAVGALAGLWGLQRAADALRGAGHVPPVAPSSASSAASPER